jgi:hypothetical protein
MGDLIGRLALWTVMFGGAFVWDYHQQRRPDTPPWARTVRRWRMAGWAAVGLVVIWLTLAPAGLTRRVDIEADRPPFPTVWWLPQPRLVAAAPLEAIILPVALIGGTLVIIGGTIVLMLHLLPSASGRGHPGAPRTSEHRPRRGPPDDSADSADA